MLLSWNCSSKFLVSCCSAATTAMAESCYFHDYSYDDFREAPYLNTGWKDGCVWKLLKGPHLQAKEHKAVQKRTIESDQAWELSGNFSLHLSALTVTLELDQEGKDLQRHLEPFSIARGPSSLVIGCYSTRGAPFQLRRADSAWCMWERVYIGWAHWCILSAPHMPCKLYPLPDSSQLGVSVLPHYRLKQEGVRTGNLRFHIVRSGENSLLIPVASVQINRTS